MGYFDNGGLKATVNFVSDVVEATRAANNKATNYFDDAVEAATTVFRHPVDTYNRNIEFYGPTVKNVAASASHASQTTDNFVGDSADALKTVFLHPVDTYQRNVDFYGPMVAAARQMVLD